MAHTALTPEEFKTRIGDLRRQDERLINVDSQPLLSYPIVRTGPNEIVVPIPKLLLDRITNGLFHDFSAHLDRTGEDVPFRTHFGELFEEYVGMQLRLVFGEHELVPETPYGAKQHLNSTPDWTVNATEGAAALECRSSTFTLNTRKCGEIELIKRDLERIGVETLVRLDQKSNDMQAGLTPVHLLVDEPIRKVLCTYESLEPLGLFGGLLKDRLVEELGGEPETFHLMPLPYLERLCAGGSRALFYRGLAELRVDDRWKSYFDEGPMARFEAAMGGAPDANPITSGAYERFSSAIPDAAGSE